MPHHCANGAIALLAQAANFTLLPVATLAPDITVAYETTVRTSHINPGLNYTEQCPHFCAPVIHPVTGESITAYKKLQQEPLLAATWSRAFGKEFGNLAQGDAATNTPGTDSIFVLMHAQC